MFEKKNLVINCSLCDARKVQEEELAGYEQIVLNTNIVLVDERSKAVLNRLPMQINSSNMLETEKEVSIISSNGSYEINGETMVEDNSLLIVNGSLVVRPGTEKILQKFSGIYVNGSVKCPESLVPYMSKLSLNGSMQCIPDDYKELDSTYVIDKYFPLRAKQDGKYYVEWKVILTDPEVNVAMLANKNVQFRTRAVTVSEELAADALGMFDENVQLNVVPAGYAYVGGDVTLDEALLCKYGSVIYVDGNLSLNAESESCLEQLEKVYVNGDVRLLKKQAEAFGKVNAQYHNLVFTKGRYIANKVQVVVDQALLDASPDGVEIGNCASLKVKADARPEDILDKLWVGNCAHASCSPEQKSALQLVCGNVAAISDGTEEEDGNGMMNPLSMLKNLVNTKVINAEKHIL